MSPAVDDDETAGAEPGGGPAPAAGEARAEEEAGRVYHAGSRVLDTLRLQSKRPGNDAVRMAARRVIVSSWGDFNEAATADVEAGRIARATTILELMGRMRPESAMVDYRLARAFARAGNKHAAVQALRNAVRKGLGDAALRPNRDATWERTSLTPGQLASGRKSAGVFPPKARESGAFFRSLGR